MLFKDGGKQVESWDLEGEAQLLWGGNTPYKPTEITWNSEGEPQLLLLNTQLFQWVCLNLANSKKTVQGSETSWNYKGLSSEYCQCAKGQQVGLWEASTGSLDLPANPTPVHTLEGEVLFLLSQPGILSISSQTQHSPTQLVQGWEGNPPLLVQPTANSPQYLATIARHGKLLSIKDTSNWETVVFIVDTLKSIRINLHYTETAEGPTLIVYLPLSRFWVLRFDPQTEVWAHKHTFTVGNSGPRCDRLIGTFNPYILQVSGFHLHSGIDQTLGSLSIWDFSEKAPTATRWEVPELQDLALCRTPTGHPCLAQLAGGQVAIQDLTGNSSELSPFPSLTQRTIRRISSSSWSTLAYEGAVLALTVFLMSLSVLNVYGLFRLAPRIWRARPVLSRS